MAKTYRVNEVFYSLQGEGLRAGTANVFVRFSGCNLACDVAPGLKSPGGFACDTEFVSGVDLTLELLHAAVVEAVASVCSVNDRLPWIVLTGGEPALQVDKDLCNHFHKHGYKLAIETNGSIALPVNTDATIEGLTGVKADTLENALACYALDWICVSPKVAEHAVKQLFAHEVKYVRGAGQGIPKPRCEAIHRVLSPAFNGNQIDPRALETCVRLCLENPTWRLSVQQHKAWRLR